MPLTPRPPGLFVRSWLLGFCLVSVTSGAGFLIKEISVPGWIQSVTVGDFNGDSLPDIAVRTTEDLTVLLNTGGGNLSAIVRTPLPYGWALATVMDFGIAKSEVAADFNGDGNLDLAIRDRNDILFGLGNGTFLPPQAIGGEHPAFYGLTAAGDFDADEKPDLVFFAYGSLGVLLGNGDGTFRLGSHANVGGDGQVLVSDFNSDGRSDLAYIHHPAFPNIAFLWARILLLRYNLNCCDLRIFLGKGDGAFEDSVPILGIGPGAIIEADFNSDGVPDIAAPNTVLLGKGDGTFDVAPPFSWAESDWYQIPAGPAAAADLDGDSRLDLIYFDTSEGRTAGIFQGKGDGTFVRFPLEYGFWPNFLWENVDRRIGSATDLDGDGRPDFVAAIYCALRSEYVAGSSAFGCSAGSNNLSIVLNRIEVAPL